MCYYDPEKDIIYMSKKTLKNKKVHDLILQHEIKHYKAKRDWLKQISIDLRDVFNKDFQKALKTIYTPKDYILDIIPIRKYHDGYHINLTVFFMWVILFLSLIIGWVL